MLLATLVVLSVVFFFINVVMDRWIIKDIHREVKLGIVSMLFWLAGAACAACAFIAAVRLLGAF